MSTPDYSRLEMKVGEAMFSQRSIRRFRRDPIPIEDIHLILRAASKAPNGGNAQIARFLVVTDRDTIQEFGPLYREAWWNKRKRDYGWTGPQDIPPDHPHFKNYRSAMRLAEQMKDVPAVIFACSISLGRTLPDGSRPLPGADDSEVRKASSVFPACQNLMLAARVLGIGSCPTRLEPGVLPLVHALFGIPDDVTIFFCITLGYPRGNFGPTKRRPTSETSYLDHWGEPVPWAESEVLDPAELSA